VFSCSETFSIDFARRFRSFADRLRYFIRLAKPDADFAVVIARDDQRAKAETAAAFHYLRAAVDKDHFLRGVASCRRRFIGAAIRSSALIW
jgi:recombinational DNA repair ATPase RecF